MYGYIYKTTNLLNGKIYIGQRHSNKFLGQSYLGSGKRLRDAIKHYGEENFKVELIEEIETKELMDVREIYWISYYKSTNKEIGYNISEGGNVNRTMVGENNPFYGKHHSKENIEKFKKRKTTLGRKHTLEELEKISKGNKGKIISSETKLKLSLNAKNNPNYGMKGKEVSNETKLKLSKAKKGKPSGAKGKIHITNEVEDKMIPLNELEHYLKLGWRRGRKKFSKKACKNISKGHKGIQTFNKGWIWVSKEENSKFISPEELNLYEELGWTRGRK